MKKTIELYRNSNPIVVDAFDTVVANICLQHERHNYKSFLITGCEPSVGTTSISIQLAMSLALTGWHTLLLDGDMRKNSNYKRLSENIFIGLADYIRGNAEESDIIYPTNINTLDYIPFGNLKDESPLRVLYSQNLSILLTSLHQMYDYIIIDAPAANTSVDSHIMSVKANATILVSTLDGSSRKYLEQAREQISKSGGNVIGVIPNKASIASYKEYVKDFDYFSNKRYLHGNHLRFDGFSKL